MPTAKEAVARVGFNVPNLDGEGERRVEPGDVVPAGDLTKKQLAGLVEQGVIDQGDDTAELGWSQVAVMVDGEHLLEPDQDEVAS